MKLFKITITTLAVSTSLMTGLAYANYVNPFIDNSSTNQAPTSAPDNATTPQANPAPSQPVYDFTKRNPGLNQPISSIMPSPTANNSVPASTTMGPVPNPPSSPNLGPAGTQQAQTNSLLQAIQALDVDVKNTNKLQITKWNQSIQNQAQANAMLLPTNLNFLWGQTAYQNMQQLLPGANSSQAFLQSSTTAYSQSLCAGLGGSTQSCQQSNLGNLSNLMTPQAISQFSPSVLSSAQNQNSQIIDTSFINSLLGAAQTKAVQNSQSNQLSILTAAHYTLSTIATSNQADAADGIDSPMNILNSAVSAPLSNATDPDSGQTWFQQLSVASTPQLLRSVAIMLALNNYLQYQNLKAAQNQQLLQAAQLVEEVRVEQAIAQLDTNQSARQSDALLQIGSMLQKNGKH